MRKLIFCLAVATTIAPNMGHAQVTVDMSRVICGEYAAMAPERTRLFSAWMSGWYNHRLGYITVGFNDFATNIASVKQFCASFPAESVMAALDRSRPVTGAPGQIKVDMSLITCKQYLSSDPERQETIAYWMSGYLHAARNQPVLDFSRLANNRKLVGAYLQEKRRRDADERHSENRAIT